VSRPDIAARLREIYALLDARYHKETWHWYPEHVRGPLDVIAGAVLVQHTNWRNAERALERLRDAGALDPEALLSLPDDDLHALIAVSGTPTVKARRLRALARTIADAGGIGALLALPQDELRARLLATHGVGPETADAIVLYAAGRPSFVIDAYTRRTFTRIGLTPAEHGYHGWQRWFERALAADIDLYRRYHAYIVLHAKDVCRAAPRCGGCVLRVQCATGVGAATTARVAT
jgi:endonuclease-3 related protein